MSSAALQTAIEDKFVITGVANVELHYVRAPSDAVKPYVVFSFLNTAREDIFRTKIFEEDVQFNIINNSMSSVNLYTIKEEIMDLYDNVSLTVTGYKDVTLYNNLLSGPFSADEVNMEYVVAFNGKAQKE